MHTYINPSRIRPPAPSNSSRDELVTNSRVEGNQFGWSWKEANSYHNEIWNDDEEFEDTLTMGSARTIR
jgi:hypothetical protein